MGVAVGVVMDRADVSVVFVITENMERSNLYLKLFKLVFGSVTIFAQENELMLKVCVYMYV